MDYYCYELVLASDEIGGIHMHPMLLVLNDYQCLLNGHLCLPDFPEP